MAGQSMNRLQQPGKSGVVFFIPEVIFIHFDAIEAEALQQREGRPSAAKIIQPDRAKRRQRAQRRQLTSGDKLVKVLIYFQSNVFAGAQEITEIAIRQGFVE